LPRRTAGARCQRQWCVGGAGAWPGAVLPACTGAASTLAAARRRRRRDNTPVWGWPGWRRHRLGAASAPWSSRAFGALEQQLRDRVVNDYLLNDDMLNDDTLNGGTLSGSTLAIGAGGARPPSADAERRRGLRVCGGVALPPTPELGSAGLFPPEPFLRPRRPRRRRRGPQAALRHLLLQLRQGRSPRRPTSTAVARCVASASSARTARWTPTA
jgi:hypothetical protein